MNGTNVFSGTAGANGLKYTKLLAYLTSSTRNQSSKDLVKEVLIGFILLISSKNSRAAFGAYRSQGAVGSYST